MVKKDRHSRRIPGIAAFSSIDARVVLLYALAAAVAGTLLFVAGHLLPVAVPATVMLQPAMFVTAHLLMAFGGSILLWAVVSVPDEMTGECEVLNEGAAIVNAIYHLAAAVGVALGYRYGMYYVVLVLWWLRSLAGLFVIIDFVLRGDGSLQLAGVLMLLFFIAGCPYLLPDLWGVLQWAVAKVAVLWLCVQLYRCAVRLYRHSRY